MRCRYMTNGLTAIAVAAVVPALADSIDPSSFIATLDEGESVTITKTVTVDPEATTSKVDVFFLTDSTGSMGGAITSVKSSATAILTAAAGLGDVAFGVGEYRDIYDTFTYRINQNMTTSQPAAQAGINMWNAAGGGDWQEANLYALEQVAETTTWRAGSERILVWFGDAPGHDPRAGSTEASATAALVAADVQVEAIDVGSLNYYGQAQRIANATGGNYYSGVSSSAIVAVIQDAITTAVNEYSTVGLDLSEVPVGVTVLSVPGSYAGDYDRSSERTFAFDVTITGDAAGTYDFNIYATVDGGRVATETDRITVTSPGPSVPEGGSTAILLGLGALSLLGLRRMS